MPEPTTRRSAPGPSPRSEIRLVTVVWGKSYVEAMLQLAWRSMLSAGNLAAMADQFDLSYALYISEEDLAAVTQSRQFALMSQFVRFELHPVRNEEGDNRYARHWSAWNTAVASARADKAIIFLVIPDVMYFDGTLRRWANIIASGKRAIFTIGTWVAEETFIPELNGLFPPESHDSVSLRPDEGMRLMLKHMHPIVAATFRQSGHAMFHFDRMTDCVPGQGFASRSFSSQPLVFDPSHFLLDSNKCPLNRFEDMAFEDVCILSTGSMLHVMEFYHGQPPFEDRRITGLVNWAISNVGLGHAYESCFSYRYPRQDVTIDKAAWEKVEQPLNHARDGVFAINAIGRIWRHAQAKGCHLAANAIAVASWQHGLCRAISLERDYTVFLPVDGAFSDWAPERMEATLLGKHAVPLLQQILDHIVPHRLYLRSGDRLVTCGDRTGAKSDKTILETTTLSGMRIRIVRGETDSDAESPTIIEPQSRVAFGAVYCIDALLKSVPGIPAGGRETA